jgi:hypothetical protein
MAHGGGWRDPLPCPHGSPEPLERRRLKAWKLLCEGLAPVGPVESQGARLPGRWVGNSPRRLCFVRAYTGTSTVATTWCSAANRLALVAISAANRWPCRAGSTGSGTRFSLERPNTYVASTWSCCSSRAMVSGSASHCRCVRRGAVRVPGLAGSAVACLTHASVCQHESRNAMTFLHSALHALQYHRQLCSRDRDRLVLTAHVERGRPLLEPPVREPEPVPVPRQQLDAVPRRVVKHKHGARGPIDAELVAHQRAETVAGLAKVHRVPAQRHVVCPAQAQHPRSRAPRDPEQAPEVESRELTCTQ